MAKYHAKLKPGRFMMLTHREGYSLDDGTTIGTKAAEKMIGLFSAMPIQRKDGPVMRANEDGLFPGHSQTWIVESNGR